MAAEGTGGGFFKCDACGYWGMSLHSLEGQTHLVKRIVTLPDLEEMVAEKEVINGNLNKIRDFAEKGGLTVIRKCGTFQRVSFETVARR